MGGVLMGHGPQRDPAEGHPALPTTTASVIVVTYNNGRHIDALLDSLPAASTRDVDVVVVDNGSTDDTVARVARRPGVRVIDAGGNVGYSAGINIGRRYAAGPGPLVILNADLVLRPAALDELAAALEDRTVGIAVPRLLNGDGTLFHHLRHDPTVLNGLGDALFGDRWPTRAGRLSEPLLDDAAYGRPHDVEWAGGAALMVSRECDAAVGDWCETFFLYAEETDYMQRARDAGFRVRYVPTSLMVHAGGGSGTRPDLVALMSVNRWSHFRSRHGAVSSAVYRATLLLRHLLRARGVEHRRAATALVSRRSRSLLPHGDPPAPRIVSDGRREGES